MINGIFNAKARRRKEMGCWLALMVRTVFNAKARRRKELVRSTADLKLIAPLRLGVLALFIHLRMKSLSPN
jgi:hypothetical protein